MLRQFIILIRLNLKAGFARPKTALTAAGFMFANNLIFFIVWVVFFSHFSSIRGWQQPDVALLIGIVAWAVGSSLFLAGGMRDIARAIVDGNLDVHLGRPTHPLPSLIFSRSIPAGLGDMATALLFWFTIGGQSLTNLPSLLLIGTAAAFVFVATNTIVQSAAFWISGMVQLAEEVLSLMILVSAYPQHTFGFALKLVLYTSLPHRLHRAPPGGGHSRWLASKSARCNGSSGRLRIPCGAGLQPRPPSLHVRQSDRRTTLSKNGLCRKFSETPKKWHASY